MKKFHQLKVFSVILLLSVGLWRCYDEPLEEYSPQTRQGQLTVQEAHSLFMEYASNLTLSRSITPGASRIPLNPGIITPAWEEATLSTTNVNSYVNVPIQTTNAFAVKSPRNDTWVDVIQKLVVVQDDGSHRRNVYLLSIIPEKEFARKSPAEIMRQCDGGNMPDDFSGLIVYTKPQGGIPVYAGSFQDGKLSREIFLFNKTRSFQENLTVLNNILKGYTIRSTTNVPMSRSFSEGGWTGGGSTGGGNTGGSGSGGGGDDWQFHTEGDPFTRDGYTCWNSSDGNGNSYIVADTDGDGKPDTIIDNDTDVNPGGGETGGNTGGIGGNTGGTGGNTGESGGDVNPGGGGHGGGTPPRDSEKTSKVDTATINSAVKKAVAKILEDYDEVSAHCNHGVQNAFNEIYSTHELDNKRANDIVEYWEKHPDKWESITMADAQKLANEGWFVVAGWKNEPGKSGHVVVIVPGTEKNGWGGKVPNAMDTGQNMRTISQPLSYSFSKSKKANVKFFKYK